MFIQLLNIWILSCATIVTFLEHNAHWNIKFAIQFYTPYLPQNKTHVHYKNNQLKLGNQSPCILITKQIIKKVVKFQDISIMI